MFYFTVVKGLFVYVCDLDTNLSSIQFSLSYYLTVCKISYTEIWLLKYHTKVLPIKFCL